jgi:hypothetical protein
MGTVITTDLPASHALNENRARNGGNGQRCVRGTLRFAVGLPFSGEDNLIGLRDNFRLTPDIGECVAYGILQFSEPYPVFT